MLCMVLNIATVIHHFMFYLFHFIYFCALQALIHGHLVVEEQDQRKKLEKKNKNKHYDYDYDYKSRKDGRDTDREDYYWQDTEDDRRIAEQQWMATVSYDASDGDYISQVSVPDLLKHCGMSEKNKKLLRDKFSESGPSMTEKKLWEVLTKLGVVGHKQAYFAAFSRKAGRAWISVDDFMFGCAALDTRTPNTGIWRTHPLDLSC